MQLLTLYLACILQSYVYLLCLLMHPSYFYPGHVYDVCHLKYRPPARVSPCLNTRGSHKAVCLSVSDSKSCRFTIAKFKFKHKLKNTALPRRYTEMRSVLFRPNSAYSGSTYPFQLLLHNPTFSMSFPRVWSLIGCISTFNCSTRTQLGRSTP